MNAEKEAQGRRTMKSESRADSRDAWKDSVQHRSSKDRQRRGGSSDKKKSSSSSSRRREERDHRGVIGKGPQQAHRVRRREEGSSRDITQPKQTKPVAEKLSVDSFYKTQLVEVYSRTAKKWCSGHVTKIDDKQLNVRYEAGPGTWKEKTIYLPAKSTVVRPHMKLGPAGLHGKKKDQDRDSKSITKSSTKSGADKTGASKSKTKTLDSVPKQESASVLAGLSSSSRSDSNRRRRQIQQNPQTSKQQSPPPSNPTRAKPTSKGEWLPVTASPPRRKAERSPEPTNLPTNTKTRRKTSADPPRKSSTGRDKPYQSSKKSSSAPSSPPSGPSAQKQLLNFLQMGDATLDTKAMQDNFLPGTFQGNASPFLPPPMQNGGYRSTQSRRVAGDWRCNRCNFDNFSKREECLKCKTPKPKS